MAQQNNWQQGVWGNSEDPANNQHTPPNASAAPEGGVGAPSPADGQVPPSPQGGATAPRATYAYAAPSGSPVAPPPPPYGFGGAPRQRDSKGKGWIIAVAAIVCVCLVLLFGMFSCTSMMGGFATAIEDSDGSAYTAGPSVAVIELTGSIQYDGSVCSPEGLKAQLDRAEADPNIKAVVLRVDSNGGTATAGEEMSVYVREFSKPVVVSSASMNASAAYEISSQADYIYTARTTAIGAIGTYISITDTSELLAKLGIRVENIKSTDSKDSTNGTRPLSDDERAAYQHMVDQINDTFIQTVAEGRGMEEDDVRALATGMTFTGTDAVANGLADEIGTLEDAQLKAAELAGIDTSGLGDSFDVVYLRQDTSDMTWLFDLMSSETDEDSSMLEALKLYAEQERNV